MVSSTVMAVQRASSFEAGIAQLGEQQTEVLEVPCSIHGSGIPYQKWFYFANDAACLAGHSIHMEYLAH